MAPMGGAGSEGTMYEDLWAEVERDRELRTLAEDEAGTVADVLPAGDFGVMARRDGYLEYHEVRVTEPWRESLVRREERPRVAAPVSAKSCAHCGTPFKGIARARYCGAEDCRRSRIAARVRTHRAK